MKKFALVMILAAFAASAAACRVSSQAKNDNEGTSATEAQVAATTQAPAETNQKEDSGSAEAVSEGPEAEPETDESGNPIEPVTTGPQAMGGGEVVIRADTTVEKATEVKEGNKETKPKAEKSKLYVEYESCFSDGKVDFEKTDLNILRDYSGNAENEKDKKYAARFGISNLIPNPAPEDFRELDKDEAEEIIDVLGGDANIEAVAIGVYGDDDTVPPIYMVKIDGEWLYDVVIPVMQAIEGTKE